jgi:hypothetical protein
MIRFGQVSSFWNSLKALVTYTSYRIWAYGIIPNQTRLQISQYKAWRHSLDQKFLAVMAQPKNSSFEPWCQLLLGLVCFLISFECHNFRADSSGWNKALNPAFILRNVLEFDMFWFLHWHFLPFPNRLRLDSGTFGLIDLIDGQYAIQPTVLETKSDDFWWILLILVIEVSGLKLQYCVL